MSQAKITVYIPTYNRADYLANTIQSVLDQTHQPLELLVVDDASTDETLRVVSQFLADSRVRYIRHEKNIGMAANWRSGREQVTTPYFCLLNDDDLLAPTFVEELLAQMEADPEVIVAFCDHHVIDGKGNILSRLTEKYTADYGRSGLPQGRVSHFGELAVLHRSLHISCSILRTAEVPAEFIEERARGFACGYLFYQCYLTGKSAYYIPRRLASYRIHEGNMLSNPTWSDYINDGQIFWCRKILQDALPEPLRSKSKAQIARIFSSHASGLIAAKRTKEAADFIQESLDVQPTLKSQIWRILLSMGPLGDWVLAQLRKISQASRHHTIHLFNASTSLTWGFSL